MPTGNSYHGYIAGSVKIRQTFPAADDVYVPYSDWQFFTVLMIMMVYSSSMKRYSYRNFVWLSLSLKSHYSIHSFSFISNTFISNPKLITNEVHVNIVFYGQIWTKPGTISVPTKFHVFMMLGNAWLTPCQHALIINEVHVNILFYGQIWTKSVAISVPTKFHVSIMEGSIWLTPCGLMSASINNWWVLLSFTSNYVTAWGLLSSNYLIIFLNLIKNNI